MDDQITWITIWKDLESAGEVDALGAAEYCRVKREWLNAGSPRPIIPFIRAHTMPPLPPLPAIPGRDVS